MKLFFSFFLILISSRVSGQFNTVYGQSLPVVQAEDSVFIETLKRVSDSTQYKLYQEITTQEKLWKEETMEEINYLFLPLKRSIEYTSAFGIRSHPVSGQRTFHNGVDLKAVHETVYSMANGIVKTVGYNAVAGLFIIVRHGDLESAYCHLSRIFVQEGDIIEGGKAIGISGSTGTVTGPHLHLVIRYKGRLVDPQLVIPFCKEE